MFNMKSKKSLLPTVLLALFLMEVFANGVNSIIGIVIYCAMIVSFIGGEILEKQRNKKGVEIRNKNIIAESRNGDYYLGIFVCLAIVTVYIVICAFVKSSSGMFVSINLSDNPIIIIGLVILLIAYGYFYFTSKQVIYAEGIVLANNKFISASDFVDIAFRETLIRKKKLIEITIKNDILSYTNTIRIKCKYEEEFEKVVVLITRVTGIFAKKV